ncbi:MAG TPA: VacJ family lipoprotein [Caulobacteraceae bacterium]|nr:VacJ family lipoprotein [Caulobacteraceae bacterium]
MDDPWSRFNHKSYRFTRAVDRAVIAPVIHAYIRVTPQPVRHGLSSAIDNLTEPRTVGNDILQGRFKPAGEAAGRFVLNTVFGLGGFLDVATGAGLEKHESDFGQTLGRYGAPSGPYIFVPLAGPSSVRDGFGRLVDVFADPLGYAFGGVNTIFNGARAGVGVVVDRDNADEQLNQVDSDFTDPYAAIRSAYSQQRANQIDIARGRAPNTVSDLPDFGPEPQAQPRSKTEPQPQQAQPQPQRP